MKVLQIGTSYRFGGIESFLLNYNKYINTKECDIKFDFLVIDEKDEIIDYYNKLEQQGSKIIKSINYRKHPISGFKYIKKIINEGDYEIVHYNMNSAVYLLPLMVGKFSNAKIVIAHSHNASSDKGIIKEVLHSINKKFIPFFANYFFACSYKAGSWFFSDRILKSDKFRVIRNAIECDKFYFDESTRKSVRKELKIDENDILIGNVGRFNEQKNHTYLIDIFFELYKKRKNIKMILIGEGPLKDEIEKKIKDLNLSSKIFLLGQRNDVNELMQAMDIFVMPSLYEGLPLVGIEAQCSGLQCFFSSEITNELKIINSAKFIELREKCDEWVDLIDNTIKCGLPSRYGNSEFKKNSYNIQNASKELIQIYKYMLQNYKK